MELLYDTYNHAESVWSLWIIFLLGVLFLIIRSWKTKIRCSIAYSCRKQPLSVSEMQCNWRWNECVPETKTTGKHNCVWKTEWGHHKRPQCVYLDSTLFGDYVVGLLSVGTLTEAHIKNVNKTVISSLCQGHNTQSIHCFPLWPPREKKNFTTSSFIIIIALFSAVNVVFIKFFVAPTQAQPNQGRHATHNIFLSIDSCVLLYKFTTFNHSFWLRCTNPRFFFFAFLNDSLFIILRFWISFIFSPLCFGTYSLWAPWAIIALLWAPALNLMRVPAWLSVRSPLRVSSRNCASSSLYLLAFPRSVDVNPTNRVVCGMACGMVRTLILDAARCFPSLRIPKWLNAWLATNFLMALLSASVPLTQPGMPTAFAKTSLSVFGTLRRTRRAIAPTFIPCSAVKSIRTVQVSSKASGTPMTCTNSSVTSPSTTVHVKLQGKLVFSVASNDFQSLFGKSP